MLGPVPPWAVPVAVARVFPQASSAAPDRSAARRCTSGASRSPSLSFLSACRKEFAADTSSWCVAAAVASLGMLRGASSPSSPPRVRTSPVNLHRTPHVVHLFMSVDRRADLTPRALRGFQVKPLDSTPVPEAITRDAAEPQRSCLTFGSGDSRSALRCNPRPEHRLALCCPDLSALRPSRQMPWTLLLETRSWAVRSCA